MSDKLYGDSYTASEWLRRAGTVDEVIVEELSRLTSELACANRQLEQTRDQYKQAKEAAEDILALGHPGYRLDPQWVQGEQERDRETPPPGTGHEVKHEEDQDRIDRVQQDAGEMVAPGF